MCRSYLKFSFALLLILSLIGIASGASALDLSGAHSRLRQVFSAPLIVGASVSAGHGTLGPSDVASRLVMKSSRVTNVARDGMYGRDLKNVSAENLRSYSAVLAIDFMFWDTTLDDATESLHSLHRLVTSAREAGIPLVIGDVPRLLPFIQDKNRELINRAIYAECRIENDCHVMKLDELHRQAQGPGILIEGRNYHYFELTADGLHLTATASRYLAGRIIALLQ